MYVQESRRYIIDNKGINQINRGRSPARLLSRSSNAVTSAPHSLDGRAPGSCGVKDVVNGVEQTAVSRLVDELERHLALLVAAVEAIAQVEAHLQHVQRADLGGRQGFQVLDLVGGEDIPGGFGVLERGDHHLLDHFVQEGLGAARAAHGLHGAVLGAAAEGDRLDAFVLHHLDEHGTCGAAGAVGENEDVLWGEGGFVVRELDPAVALDGGGFFGEGVEVQGGGGGHVCAEDVVRAVELLEGEVVGLVWVGVAGEARLDGLGV